MRAAGPEEDAAAEPQLFGDWREFRAKLILGQCATQPHANPAPQLQTAYTPARMCCAGDKAQQQQQLSEENLKLLEIQNPKLATEGIWAHATTQIEKGGLLLATPDNPLLLGTETYW